MIGILVILGNIYLTIVILLFIILFFNLGFLGIYVNVFGGWKVVVIVLGLIGFLEIIVVFFVIKFLLSVVIVDGINNLVV